MFKPVKIFKPVQSFFTAVLFLPFTINAQPLYSIDDASTFAAVFEQHKSISASALQQQYLINPSLGRRILGKRIGNAQQLAQTINTNPAVYKKAIELCLPVAANIQNDVTTTVKTVSDFLGQSGAIPVAITVGANNTGATVTPEGVALALEVICQQAENEQQVRQIILEYVAHETVHVLQYRNSKRTDFNLNLLEWSLIEGAADFISTLATAKDSSLQFPRRQYGHKHERALWQRFSQVMNSFEFAPWLYSPAKGEQPADMGYWLGKQIAQAYYQNSENKSQALQDLLELNDANFILKASRYTETFTD